MSSPWCKLERGTETSIWAWGLPKRRRFVYGGDKTTSFYFYLFLNTYQNDVVLDKTDSKRRCFEAAVTNLNDVVLGM